MAVLVVEDHPALRRVASLVLEQAGVEGEVVADGESAVGAAGSGAFDAIFMDIQLPGIDGIEAARRILAAGGAAPIWALSASQFGEEHQRCLEAGMRGVIDKPLTVEKLLAVLEQTGATIDSASGTSD